MKKYLPIFVLYLLLTGALFAQQLASLDEVIKSTARGVEEVLPQRTLVAVINFTSPAEAFSDYVIEELTGELVMGRKVTIVDRRSLALIRQELNLQVSGDVSDESAQAIGRMLGAQSIVSGSLTDMGTSYRFRVRVIDVETAAIRTQVSLNLQKDAQVTFLLSGSLPSAQATAPVPSQTPAAQASNPGGTATVAVPGDGATLNVNSPATWNTAINRIRSGGNNQTYIINVTGNVSVPAPPNNENIFGSVTGITVTFQGSGTISLSVNGCLLRIDAGQTVILKNVTLRGRSGNDNPVVRIMRGGVFRMEGNASVTGNASGYGGVYIDGGTFIMQDSASVSGNTTN